uniref:Macaca fascicularis brain cDNA clone: QflA-21931, similar to human hypothetical protein MGC33371 (MGC33371), mRNA, RefSeq: NM_144664.3 n=1 Tax=Macaca fascicularis TaxID=9541 RepID=I7GMF9_MACFA|nr:unnamed protein product [Macaca fascicularis]
MGKDKFASCKTVTEFISFKGFYTSIDYECHIKIGFLKNV